MLALLEVFPCVTAFPLSNFYPYGDRVEGTFSTDDYYSCIYTIPHDGDGEIQFGPETVQV